MCINKPLENKGPVNVAVQKNRSYFMGTQTKSRNSRNDGVYNRVLAIETN